MTASIQQRSRGSLLRGALLGVAALVAAAAPARAGEVVDDARLFSAEARQRAEAALDRIERETGTPVAIRTVDGLGGESIGKVVPREAARWGKKGIFVYIARMDSKVDVRSYKEYLGRDRERAVVDALVPAFRKGEFDEGLDAAVARIGSFAREVRPPVGGAPTRRPAEGGSGMPILMILGLVVFGVFVLGRLFNRRPAYGPPGGPGYGAPGMGPGYGGGGGLFSGILGGLGGALAGNWIYDQMTGRHHPPHGGDVGAGYGGGDAPPTEADWGGGATGDWGGGGDAGGDWGGGAGADWGGGDAGGGDWS